MIQSTAPNFILKDLNKNTISLESLLGKVIWLEFWVTWCPTCIARLPKLDVFYRSMKNPSLIFLTIDVTGREKQGSNITKFVKEKGYQFPVLQDNNTQTYDAYHIQSVPSVVLINKFGRIHGTYNEWVPFSVAIREMGRLLHTER